MEMDVVKTPCGAEKAVPEPLLASGGTAAVSSDEISVPSPAKVGGGALLGGRGVNAVTHAPHGISGSMPSETEVFLGIAQQMCESLKAIIDNLKPSEKEKENLRRRKEEIEKLRHELLTRKIDFQKARQIFVNMLDHEDVAELSKQSDRANGMIRG